MLVLGIAFALSLPGLVARRPVTAQVDTLRYSFEYRSAGSGAPTLAVELRFRADASGRTRLVIPSTWAGEVGLDRAITGIESGSPDVTIAPLQGDELTLTSKPRAELTLKYLVHQDWTGPLRYPLFHRVLLDASRVVFNQTTALIYPEHRLGSTMVLQVQWTGLPTDWRIISSFGSKAWFSAGVSWREFAAAFFSAGDFRLVAPPAATAGVTIAVQGQWRFGDAGLTQMVGALWGAETRFWGESAFDRAFVLLLPIQNVGTVAGTAFTAGFFAVSDTAADLKPIGRLLAHELFHLWNGQRMTAAADEARYKWFTEGVTDYYADRIFLDMGQYTASDYRDRVNGVLARYYTSPARNDPRDVVARDYWTSDDVRQYPYSQGYALALYLQANLPTWTGSAYNLDTLMVHAYAATARRGIDVSDSLLAAQVPRPGRAAFVQTVTEFIDRGTMVPADPNALGPCATVKDQPMYLRATAGAADSSQPTAMLPRGARAFIVPQYVAKSGGPDCGRVGP